MKRWLMGKRDRDETDSAEKFGYERVRGLAARPETLPTVRRGGQNHVIIELGGRLSDNLVSSNETR
jgi:hypothetical protein